MVPRALHIIRTEHRSLAAVLHALQQLARGARDGKLKPDFGLLRLIVDYIDSFHERFHHPKEDQYLFKALRERTGEGGETLAELDRQHEQSHARLAELREAINVYQSDARGAPELARQVEAYAEFHWMHMRLEEDEVLPLAERALSPEDWKEIDAAFTSNDDPLFGAARRNEYERLFHEIAELAPPPIGHGKAPT
jgi:hemerythrin-like domain-containing protein